jgi:hypothetical protein
MKEKSLNLDSPKKSRSVGSHARKRTMKSNLLGSEGEIGMRKKGTYSMGH